MRGFEVTEPNPASKLPKARIVETSGTAKLMKAYGLRSSESSFESETVVPAFCPDSAGDC
jgi:hypothetical protein